MQPLPVDLQDQRRVIGRLRALAEVAIDAAGTLYVADSWNHTIRAVSPDGTVTTYAGAAGMADRKSTRLNSSH